MFSEDLTLVNNVSAETKNAITRKSAQTLPNNPSERGYSAEEIKRRFYQPILDTANSSLAEIDRVVDEVNTALGQIDTNMDTFLEKSLIAEPYKVTIEESTWTYNEDDAIYEFFVTSDEHGISNVDEIGVDMFLLDGDGYYVSVNQFEIASDGTVHFFHESATAGYLNIYTKREGYVWGDVAVDVNKVVGISKVGISNSYNDLDDLPDLSLMDDNETMISKMISGAQKVTNAVNAENATSATYASTSGAATSASTATTATKASQDEYGVNISANYAKQNGTYEDMTVGNATNAVNAENAENAENATNAVNAENAENAELVQNVDFSSSSSSMFGDCIIEKKILLYKGALTTGESNASLENASVTISGVSSGDILEIWVSDLGSTAGHLGISTKRISLPVSAAAYFYIPHVVINSSSFSIASTLITFSAISSGSTTLTICPRQAYSSSGSYGSAITSLLRVYKIII